MTTRKLRSHSVRSSSDTGNFGARTGPREIRDDPAGSEVLDPSCCVQYAFVAMSVNPVVDDGLDPIELVKCRLGRMVET